LAQILGVWVTKISKKCPKIEFFRKKIYSSKMFLKPSLDHKNVFLGRKIPIFATFGPHFGPKFGLLGHKNFKNCPKIKLIRKFFPSKMFLKASLAHKNVF
jgi:hypothetical protein